MSQDCIKTMMLDFINKRSKMFNFKTFKVVRVVNLKLVFTDFYNLVALIRLCKMRYLN